jgi:ATP-dependent Lon protease
VPYDLLDGDVRVHGERARHDPGPLRDRMEIIQLAGYTEQEKLEIAKRYLVDRQLEANGLTRQQCEITEEALRAIITDYTREAGFAISSARSARDASRCRAHRRRDVTQTKMGIGDLHEIPRAPEVRVRVRDAHEHARRGDGARVDAGGRRHPLHRGDAHAGQRQADPHRPARRSDEGERAGGALAREGARGEARHRPDVLEKSDIHVHVPAGATPKDGPSAGVAMFLALVVAADGRPVQSDTAMTGEISLRGLVLPIGGVKEKVLAAMRAGITRVMLPKRNRKEFEEVPEEAREKLEFVWLETVDDAIAAALEAAPVAETPKHSVMAAAGSLRSRRPTNRV